ncbi:MAG: cell wall-binding repeat-containing protein [Actinobacteria bacterium]|nr:cell wall-binding repeat-containing protein [Actinomycetota bacterium]
MNANRLSRIVVDKKRLLRLAVGVLAVTTVLAWSGAAWADAGDPAAMRAEDGFAVFAGETVTFATTSPGTVVPIVFPFDYKAKWTDTWGAPRSGGRTHAGNDLMAPKMTPIYAVADGVLDWMNDTAPYTKSTYNGVPYFNILLRGDDGNVYFYIHLNNDTPPAYPGAPDTDDGLGGAENAYAPGLKNGSRVTAGQFIGWVGDSGNAEDSGSHLHFEIHLGGYGNPINPYASLMAAPLFNEWSPDFQTMTGTDRYETAILVSKKAFPDGAPAVCVVKGDNFPDALAAAPLAYAYGGPVLLTPSSGLTDSVKEELLRLKPGKVFFVGLPPEVRPGIASALPDAEIITVRGRNRYETAAFLAEQLKLKLGKVERIVLASGDDFPDALSVAPLAAKKGWAILLTPQAGPLPKVTSAQIESLGTTFALVVGTYVKPPDSVAQVVTQIGTDRYDTSALVAGFAVTRGLSFTRVALATGENYPDALVVGPYLAREGGILLLTMPTGVPACIKEQLTTNRDDIQTVELVGLSSVIESALRRLR